MKRRPIGESPPLPIPKIETFGVSYDIVNEQLLIVAACMDAEIRKGLTQRIRPDLFMADEHQVIWASLTEIARRDLDFDIATVHQLAGGNANTGYLTSLLAQRAEVPPNLRHHVEMLFWDRARIECVRGPLQELLRCIQDSAAPADRTRAIARSVLTSLESGTGSRALIHDPRRLRDRSEALLNQFAGPHFPYGIPGLDMNDDGTRRITIGTAPGKVTVVTAITGSAKSTVVGQIALSQGPGIPRIGVEGLGRKVLLGAWEMQADMLANLFACMSLGLDRSRMLSGMFTVAERRALSEERDRISEYIRFVDQPITKGKTANEDAMSIVHGMIIDSACEVAVFDLWERAFSFENPQQEKEFLIQQQEIFKQTCVHGILTAQQRKDIESRPDKRPTLETIAGSGGWGQIADTILGTYFPWRYKDLPRDSIEILLLKQRYGDWPLLVRGHHDTKTGLTTDCRLAPLKRYDGDGNDFESW